MTLQTSPSSYPELLRLARDIAVQAGELAVRRRGEDLSIAGSKSSASDIVTNVDREVENMIRAAITSARPDDGFYGEESDGASGTSGLTWVVDPIDGTVNFFYGLPYYSVSIAVVEGGTDPRAWTPLVGVVVNPVTGDVYSASRGGGAYRNDELRLSVNADVPLDAALVGTGFSYLAPHRVEQSELLTGLIGRVRDVRRHGSVALDLGALADGRIDAFYERYLSPWDYAAGALIAEEAGARVSLTAPRDDGSLLFAAAAPSLLVALESYLTEYGA